MSPANNLPSLEEFKTWCRDHRRLALSVCQAKALALVTRERVDAYIKPIFDSFNFKYSGESVEKIEDRGGESILGKPLPSPRELYLCDDPRIEEYFAACDAEHRRQGYTDLQPGYCPALVAESLLIDAENALMEAANPLFGLSYSPSGEDRDKYLKLLIGACLKDA